MGKTHCSFCYLHRDASQSLHGVGYGVILWVSVMWRLTACDLDTAHPIFAFT